MDKIICIKDGIFCDSQNKHVFVFKNHIYDVSDNQFTKFKDSTLYRVKGGFFNRQNFMLLSEYRAKRIKEILNG